MALTGDPDGPPLAPDTTAASLADDLLAPFGLDAGVLAERAAHLGLQRAGLLSCGGATALLEGSDGWMALALPRPDDLHMVPALLGIEMPEADPWPPVTAAVRHRPVDEVVDQAVLLGMAAGRVGASAEAAVSVEGAPRARSGTAAHPVVADLSALWAGPLCSHLLQRAGATVVKVESTPRPDGARSGVGSFFDLLNHGKASVSVDLTTPEGRAHLARLVETADIVITSSRRRAFDQLGLEPNAFLAGGADRVWVAVTGHGWQHDRVGFGDDAAATAGLVAWGADGRPRFAADAIADPLCGTLAAHHALECWHAGGRWFIDAPLAGAARRCVPAGGTGTALAAGAVGDGGWAIDEERVAPPQRREADGPAEALGASTRRITG